VDKQFSVDTSQFADGPANVRFAAEDVAGNIRDTNRTITVDNHPPVAGTVSVTGTARENDALTAEVAGFDGQGVSYEYRWQRCSADGTGCADIGGAIERTYTLRAADVGKRVRSKVLATDHGGTVVAYSDVMSRSAGGGVVQNDPTNDSGGSAPGGGGGSQVPVPNGDNPSRRAKVSAVVDRKGKTITTAFGKTVRVTGKLVDEHGKPIRNALVEVQAVRRVPRAVPLPEGGVRTNANGAFAYVARASASRELRFVYRAYSTDRDITSKSSVVLLVRAAGTFKASPGSLRNGHTVTFSGALKGGLMPHGGTLVEVQVRYCMRVGRRTRCEWRLVRSVRTSRAGAFKAQYTFRRTTATTTYVFRAKARGDSAWPFVGGIVGRGAKVTVRP
jgi:hypothetical protein